MTGALWLLRAVPLWYFETILDPFGAGPFSMFPALGVLCLAAGILLAIIQRSRVSFLFLIPFAVSEAFVAAAGALRGQVAEPVGGPALLGFLGVQLVLAIGLIWRLRGRAPALLLAAFSVTYALFAAFVAAMSFANDWI